MHGDIRSTRSRIWARMCKNATSHVPHRFLFCVSARSTLLSCCICLIKFSAALQAIPGISDPSEIMFPAALWLELRHANTVKSIKHCGVAAETCSMTASMSLGAIRIHVFVISFAAQRTPIPLEFGMCCPLVWIRYTIET